MMSCLLIYLYFSLHINMFYVCFVNSLQEVNFISPQFLNLLCVFYICLSGNIKNVITLITSCSTLLFSTFLSFLVFGSAEQIFG